MKTELTLNQALCYAIGRDAGNRSMRRHGRTQWNESDYNVAAKAYQRAMNPLKRKRA